MTSCSDNDNDESAEQNTIEMSGNGKSITITAGDTLKIILNKHIDQTDYSLFVNDKQVNFRVYAVDINSSELYFIAGKSLSGISNQQVLLKQGSQIVGRGPYITVSRAYKAFVTGNTAQLGHDYSRGIYRAGENTVAAVFTMSDLNPNNPEYLWTKVYFNGMYMPGTSDYPDIHRENWNTVLPIFPTETMEWGFSYLDQAYPQGLTSRDNSVYFRAKYIYQPNKKERYDYNYILINDNGIIKPFRDINTILENSFENFISHIQVDSKENIYVVLYNQTITKNCIYKLIRTGEPWKMLWAGSETETGTADGAGTDARFGTIVTMRIDKDDNLYVAEKDKIRKISPTGNVTTLALASGTLNDIQGMDIADDGQIYILDGDLSKLKIIDPETLKVVSFPIYDMFERDTKWIEAPIIVNENGIVVVSHKGYAFFVTPENMWPEDNK